MFLRALVLLPRTAQAEASQGYELMSEEFTRLSGADAEALDADVGAPLGTVRTVTCAVEPSDRGGFVADHRNDCTLREPEVRAVPQDAPEAADRAANRLRDAPAPPDGARLLVVVRLARISSSSLGCLPLPVVCEPTADEPQLPDALKG
ncbi:hypothetical protein FM106_30140 [Brachybacterium faecium]|nr:hypothetical protein FM106_30140 [Brachybacterium faecium]